MSLDTYEGDAAAVARALVATQGNAERAVFMLVAEASELHPNLRTRRGTLTDAAIAIANAEVLSRVDEVARSVTGELDSADREFGQMLELPRRPAC